MFRVTLLNAEWLVVRYTLFIQSITEVALATPTNQRRPSLRHDIWKFQTKLRSRRLALISIPGISTCMGPSLTISPPCLPVRLYQPARKRYFGIDICWSYDKYLFCIAFNSGCWMKTPDAHGFGGLTHLSFSTLEECQALCVSNKECVAIDWEPSNVQNCWILNLHSIGPMVFSGVVTHYELNRTCLAFLSESQYSPPRRTVCRNRPIIRRFIKFIHFDYLLCLC